MSFSELKKYLRENTPLRKRWRMELAWASLPLLEILANPIVFFIVLLALALWISESFSSHPWRLQ